MQLGHGQLNATSRCINRRGCQMYAGSPGCRKRTHACAWFAVGAEARPTQRRASSSNNHLDPRLPLDSENAASLLRQCVSSPSSPARRRRGPQRRWIFLRPVNVTAALAATMSQPGLLFDDDDRSFIVLTETKFSFRCIPVWDRYSPHLTRVEKKTHVIMLSP